ncbi:hypothetical protein DY000_02049020 [Brassica cretica]|uniref:Uncharacterized protein n=1 Tax=Brassica cretica TaxID=69181 RepID=A0ABQ7F4L0_BRACR|nr:hypothetical protein DY000_02049020 [Brassica cretica]
MTELMKSAGIGGAASGVGRRVSWRLSLFQPSTEICGLRAVEEDAKIAHAGVEFVSKVAAEMCRMPFGIRTTDRGTLRLPCIQR